MLQREIRLKEVQDATYDDMCRLLNERKLCNVERCTGMGKTTIFLRYIREHPDETVLYFYDTDDIKNKIKTETDGKDVLLMSYQKLFRTAARSVITYLEDKDIDILILMRVTAWALKQLGRSGILSSPTVLNKESKW